MAKVLYSSLPCQKSSALLVSSISSSFYPSTSVIACEVDSSGFDLCLVSEVELTEQMIQVLQEEVRRQRGHLVLTTYSMMLKVVKEYALRERKRLGPLPDCSPSEVVEVGEIKNYCGFTPGPYEENLLNIGELFLFGGRATRQEKTWLWHIRGSALVDKKAKKLLEWQGKLFHERAEKLFERLSLSQLTQGGSRLWLPQGVQLKKALLAWLTSNSVSWIEESGKKEMHCRSDEALFKALFLKSQAVKRWLTDGAYECVSTLRSPFLRLPMGEEVSQTALVRYVPESKGSLESMAALFRSIRLPFSIQIQASSQSLFHRLEKLVYSTCGDVAIEYEQVPAPYAALLFVASHLDGRRVPVSAFLVDQSKQALLVEIPALSLERWMGLMIEICQAPPFWLSAGSLALLVPQELLKAPEIEELKEKLEKKRVTYQLYVVSQKEMTKKRMELKEKEVHYVAYIQEDFLRHRRVLFFTPHSKRGLELSFGEMDTFFETLPTRQLVAQEAESA